MDLEHPIADESWIGLDVADDSDDDYLPSDEGDISLDNDFREELAQPSRKEGGTQIQAQELDPAYSPANHPPTTPPEVMFYTLRSDHVAKNPSSNKNTDRQDALVFLGDSRFRWRGRTCTCDPTTASSTWYCAVADFLRLKWLHSEGGFICLSHNRIIPFADLESHLTWENGHPIQSLLNNTTLHDLLEHVQNMFHVAIDQTQASFDLSWERPAAIEDLHPPQRCAQCPSCQKWFKLVDSENQEKMSHILRNLSRHYSRSSCVKPADGTSLQVRWTQSPFSNSSGDMSRFPILPSMDDKPFTATIPLPHRLTKSATEGPGAIPSYIHALGWDDVLESLNADARDLIALILPPQKPNTSMSPTERHLEIMLAVIDRFGEEYLLAASTYAHDLHMQVAQSLTAGSSYVIVFLILQH